MENGAADRRIRVVFADELGRHVQRRCGFLSCWYLVPRDAKLVGDLAHALVREFDLRDRCPRGVELLLDDLPVLATQHAHIIRDDDTIVVQCPLVDVPASSSSGTSSSSSSASSSDEDEGGSGVKALSREHELGIREIHRLLASLKKESPAKSHMKKARRSKLAAAGLSRPPASREAASEKKQRAKSTSKIAEAVQNIVKKNSDALHSESSSSDSDSDSDSDSSSSSSSDSESEAPVAAATAERKRKREGPEKRVPNSTKKTERVCLEPKTSQSKAGQEAPAESRRRPRRRLRSRQRGRGGRGSAATKAAKEGVDGSEQARAPLNGTKVSCIPPQSGVAGERERDLPSLQQANGRQNRGVAGPRGFPRAQKHVVFDEKTGEQVAVEQEADLPVDNDGEGRWMPRRSKVPSELDKYGPSSSDSRQPRASRDQPVRSYEWSSNSTHGNGGMTSSNGITPKRKGKWEERWKRPYVVVASVLDKKPEDSDGAASTADLTTMLAAYPTSSLSSSRFQVKDVLAFKTLTLCLETWQPVLSEWQCGQVQTVDSSGSTIDVSNWTLAASNEDNTAASVTFCEASGSEQRTLQTSEISELRYLDGPSFLALQKADDLPGPSEQQTPPPSASTDEELAPQPAASQ